MRFIGIKRCLKVILKHSKSEKTYLKNATFKILQKEQATIKSLYIYFYL